MFETCTTRCLLTFVWYFIMYCFYCLMETFTYIPSNYAFFFRCTNLYLLEMSHKDRVLCDMLVKSVIWTQDTCILAKNTAIYSIIGLCVTSFCNPPPSLNSIQKINKKRNLFFRKCLKSLNSINFWLFHSASNIFWQVQMELLSRNICSYLNIIIVIIIIG